MASVSLGPREQEVMKCVWRLERCSVRDVVNCLREKDRDNDVAYNTIQTVMTRLIDKGLLERNNEGRSHIYRPKKAKKRTLRSAIGKSMSGFMNQFGEEAIIAFMDGIDDISEETRQKLIKKLRNK